MRTVRLTNHKYSQCYVNEFDSELVFVSYSTPVIIAKRTPRGNFAVSCTGLYSMTTRKQIGYFLKEYFPSLSFSDMKESAEQGTVFFASRA